MADYLHSGANKMNKVEAYINDNKLLLADKLGHAKVSSLKEQNLLNTIATVQQHSNKITQLEADTNKVRGAYVYKGAVETEFDLPLNDNSVGDVYNTSSTGMNYAWNGESWDELGSTIDDSNLVHKTNNEEISGNKNFTNIITTPSVDLTELDPEEDSDRVVTVGMLVQYGESIFEALENFIPSGNQPNQNNQIDDYNLIIDETSLPTSLITISNQQIFLNLTSFMPASDSNDGMNNGYADVLGILRTGAPSITASFSAYSATTDIYVSAQNPGAANELAGYFVFRAWNDGGISRASCGFAYNVPQQSNFPVMISINNFYAFNGPSNPPKSFSGIRFITLNNVSTPGNGLWIYARKPITIGI